MSVLESIVLQHTSVIIFICHRFSFGRASVLSKNDCLTTTTDDFYDTACLELIHRARVEFIRMSGES